MKAVKDFIPYIALSDVYDADFSSILSKRMYIQLFKSVKLLIQDIFKMMIIVHKYNS